MLATTEIDSLLYTQFVDTKVEELARARAKLFDISFFSDYIEKKIKSIETADATGLNAWGALLNESRIYTIETSSVDFEAFGFTSERLNFIGNFNGATNIVTIILSDELYRKKLIMSAYLSIRGVSIASINEAIQLVFGDFSYCYDKTATGGRVDSQSLELMTIYYVINIKVDQTIDFLVRYGLYLPRPAGVKLGLVKFNDVRYDGVYRHNGAIQYSGGLS